MALTPVPDAIQLILAALVLTAAVFDLGWRRIPNWLVLAGLAAALIMNIGMRSLEGVKIAAGGLGVAALVYLVLYALRLARAGDAKLMMAIGSMVGAVDWLCIFLLASVLGAVIGLILVIATGRLAKTLWNAAYLLKELARLRPPYARHEELDVTSEKALRLPHGCSIALGALLFLGLLRAMG